MYLVDTHTHIFTEEYDADIDAVIKRAKHNGVEKFLIPNVDVESINRLKSLCNKYPDCCFPMMGLHPTSIKDNYLNDLQIIKNELFTGNYIAVGEIGIDLYWDKTYLKQQIEAFEEQLNWSIELNLPVSIHTREAFPEVFESLNRVGADKLRGIFHSFTGSEEELKKALKYKNFKLGINGVVTYKNAAFRNYLPLAPLDRIVLETDAPYLTPVPYRGKRNEPSYLIYIVEKLAEVYNVSVEEVAERTSNLKNI
ncbi:TatD DNase family protein [Dysgonomonadaceae bacterium PH5-43]|nr:TatD DNase family protein [Dysgonomonadaceae bacterium PH5-43]